MKEKIVSNPIGFRLELQPTVQQIQRINEYFNVCRYVYNFGLGIYLEKDNLNERGFVKKRISFNTLCSKLTSHKKEKPFLEKYNIYSLRIALRDVHHGFDKYFDKTLRNRRPRFKKKKSYYGEQSFGIRNDRIVIWDNSVKISGLFDRGI